ncbi:tetratricopeptide repeat protein [Bacteroides caecigallinarum]|nr:tetratricopeptide repeat protein [Bacteroides caecigallinarum]
MKNKRNALMAGLLLVMPMAVGAQQVQPLTGSCRLFDDGKQLFLRHDYAAARQTLMQYVNAGDCSEFMDEAEYMLACTAYELNLPDRMERLESYLSAHPESRYKNRVQALVASVYFFDNDYLKAIASYRGCDFDALGNEERDDNVYRLAQSYQQIGNTTEAAAWFTVLKSGSSKYADDATYNLAYIDYSNGRYSQAMKGFVAVCGNKNYAQLAPYYMADISLITGDYAKARSVADEYLKNYPGNEKTVEMRRIAGEAAYAQKNYSDAVRNLSAYCNEVSNPQRNALYKLGMSYYYTQVYSEAAASLGRVTGPDDDMSQNAYLHMGLAYLNLKERNQARMAFEQAAASNRNMQIKEQALYNYALCIHDTSYSPFAESVTVFERFLNEFPHSQYTDKVNDYLIEVYMNTRSYMAALNSIAKISQPGTRILEAKQKLLFRLGTQAFAQASFENAIDYFSQSLQLGRYNAQTKADSYFWRGEAKYRLDRFAQAAADYRQYMEFATDKKSMEYGLALYNMGYTSFKQKNYDKALTWFVRCADTDAAIDASVRGDACNRAGDCYFYARRFDEARAQYARAVTIEPSYGDYSLFQEAFVKGLQRDYTGKIETLNTLFSKYPSSQYIDDALYEQGRAFVQMEQADNAIGRYKILVEKWPESQLARKAASEIALLYYQNDKFNEAIAAYKKVIADYPGSEEAKMAQRDLKSVYIDINKVDEYMSYASSLPGGANFDVNERDSLTYVAAERVYMRGNIAEAKNSFTSYLQSFPQGAFSVNASYYLGIIAYNEKDYQGAATYLNKVLEYPDSKFSTEAMTLCAQMAYNGKEYGRSLELYKRLSDRAGNQEERLQAQTGALRSAYMAGDTNETISAASAMMAHSKLAPELENEARYYRAKAFIRNGQSNEALADLKVLAADTRNVYGAEAKYLVAQIYFDEGKTEAAENEVLQYIEVSTPHAYWLARSFVLLSDVYVKLGRKLDAKQYLLSLQQNYQADDDIAEMIETRLAKLNQ